MAEETEAQGPLSKAMDNLRRLVAASTTFQAWCGAANANAALDSTFRVDLPKPAGDRYTVAELQQMRPFALVDLYREGNGFGSKRRSDGGGGPRRYLDRFRMVLTLEADVPAEVADNVPELETRFLNQVGNVITDIQTLAGEDDLLTIGEITILEGPSRSDEDEVSSGGDYQRVVFLLEAGV